MRNFDNLRFFSVLGLEILVFDRMPRCFISRKLPYSDFRRFLKFAKFFDIFYSFSLQIRLNKIILAQNVMNLRIDFSMKKLTTDFSMVQNLNYDILI